MKYSIRYLLIAVSLFILSALMPGTSARRNENRLSRADKTVASAGLRQGQSKAFARDLMIAAPAANADLAITETDSADPVNTGKQLTYTITVTNNGSDAAGSASWSDTLPAGTTFVSLGTASGAWSCTTPNAGDAGTVTCANPSFAVGSATFDLTVTVSQSAPAGSTISNTATVSSSTPDNNIDNNSATETTLVLSPSSVIGRKVMSGGNTPGSTISYFIVLSNSRKSDQQDNPGDEFTDVLPAGLTLVSADAGNGTATANVAMNTVTWNGVIPAEDSVTIIITATINSGTDGQTLSNQGSVSYDADGNGTNETNTLTDDPNDPTSSSDPTVFKVCNSSSVVTTNADSGAGSLRQVIADACPGITIVFDMTQVTSPIKLTGGELVIDKNLTIQGPTNASLTISGSNSSRIFNVAANSALSISHLTLAEGSSSFGGAIYSIGDLNIAYSTFTDNHAAGEGGAIDSEGGNLSIVNSTISGNTADTDGGGLLNCGNSIGFLTNVTITNNRADADGDSTGNGGGIGQVSSSNFTLNNTIIAGNFNGTATGTPDDFFVKPADFLFPGSDPSPLDASSSNNLIGVDTGLSSDISNGSNGNKIGTSGAPIDPRLGPLANNGGPTQTHSLLPDSPALNAGNNSLATDRNGVPLATDQRYSGFPRIFNSVVDIGALEAKYGISATAGTPQSATINSTFSTQLKATATLNGSPVSGAPVTFTAPSSGASGTFQGGGTTVTVLTDANGLATAPPFTANGAPGSYVVTATLPSGLPSASFNLTNSKINQTISFGGLSNKTFGDADFTISATASSGLAVSFTASGQCTVSGNTVHLTGVGSCTITASQGGDSTYNAAADVQQTFQIAKAPTTTTVTSSANPSTSGQSVTFTATVTSNAGTPSGTVTFKDAGTTISACNNLALSSGKAACATPSLAVGNHTITADYSGDTNFASSSGTLSSGQQVNPTLSINDVSSAEGDSGTKSFQFTVTLSAASNLTVKVDFATSNGTATAGSDYVSNSGTLTFAPGDVSKTVSVVVNGDTQFETDETFFVTLTNPVNASITSGKGSGTGTILNDDAKGGIISFSQSAYTVTEGAGSILITVNRTNDTTQSASVDYQTSDQFGLQPCSTVNGQASERCDYLTALGTLSFAAGESSKTFRVFITDDTYQEGTENFSLTLSNPTNGALLGNQSEATVTISDNNNDAAGAPNPIDGADYFIREQYVDFLYREPDPQGFKNWQDTINNCPNSGFGLNNPQCDRVHVAFSFYAAFEFRDAGYLIFRFYQAVLGRRPTYREFMAGLQMIGGAQSPAELEANRQAFAAQFIQLQEFKNLYDQFQTGDALVNALIQKSGVTPSSKQTLINNYATAGRAATVRAFVETKEVNDALFNRGLVTMLYFGFLRRDPDTTGFNNYMEKLQQTGDARPLIYDFIYSTEYRGRFGQP